MTPIIFYDTETTGLPEWKLPSDSPEQPHLVQLAAILADADTQKVISSMDVIVRADDWVISPETIEVHGISNDMSKAFGVPEPLALDMFLNMWRGAPRVAHNKTFDQRIIRIAIKRYSQNPLMQDAWAEKDNHFCTMRGAQAIMGGKQPKLAEAYEHFTGNVLENAHNAMADATACMEIYWGIMGAKVAA